MGPSPGLPCRRKPWGRRRAYLREVTPPPTASSTCMSDIIDDRAGYPQWRRVGVWRYRPKGPGQMTAANIQEHPCPPYTFTAAETARLTIYRAAIHAGLYSDQSAPRPRSALATSTVVGTAAARQRMRAADTSVIDAQRSEWLAPERR